MKKVFTLLTLLVAIATSAWADDVVTWPDANYLLLDGKKSNQIDGEGGGSTSYTTQVGGTVIWSCNTSKYSYGNTTCTFYGNAFTKGLKHESATYTQVVTTGTATLTIVQSLATNPSGNLTIQPITEPATEAKDVTEFDASNLIVNTYSGSNTVGGKAYINVKVYKLCNLPAGTYKIAKSSSAQTYVVYMGVTYETTPTYTITTATSNGGTSTVSGGGSKLRGATATLTATPGTGKVFDRWELGGSNVSTDNPYSFIVTTDATYTAVFKNASTKSITVTSSNVSYGNAAATLTTVPEGLSTTLTATPEDEGYAFTGWTKSSDGSWSSSTNPLTVAYDDIVDGETYTANFRQLYKLTYSKGSYEIGSQTKYLQGTQTVYATTTDQITMPTNYGIVYSKAEAANYTLKYWSNGGGNRAAGGVFTVGEDLTDYEPVFVANTVSLANLPAQQVVTWNFDTTTGAPDIHVESADGYYVVQTTINETTIDVPLYLNNTSGKFNNTGSSTAQINSGSKLTIPAVKGMVARFTFSSSPTVNKYSTDDAENSVIEKDDKDLVVTYNGNNTSLEITFSENRYASKLVVTYPKYIPGPADPVVVGSTVTLTTTDNMEGWRSFYDESQGYTADENTTVYVATGNEDKVTLASIGSKDIPAGTPVILNTSVKTAGKYTITLTESTPAAYTGTNLLQKTTAGTAVSGYRLGYKSGNGVGFYKYSDANPADGIVYIEKTTSTPSSEFLDFFLDESNGETTGINGVVKENVVNGEFYNLSGQRVAQPTKGLYIVNGKKVVIK